MSVFRSAAKMVFAAADLLFPSPRGPRILIYHQVGAGLGRQMEVTTEAFSWQLDWLAANREVVSLDTAIERWHEPDADRLVVLTFDDGYRDTYTTAFRMLLKHGMPFVVYLATGMIEAGSSATDSGRDPPLTWEMTRKMLDSGLMTVGSHTHRHSDLRRLDRNTILSELEVSDGLISDNSGVAPRHFAYPWGYWSPQAESLIQARYSTAVLGASPRPDRYPEPHRLHRYPVQLSDGTTFFELRLRGGLLLEEQTRRVIRGYKGP